MMAGDGSPVVEVEDEVEAEAHLVCVSVRLFFDSFIISSPLLAHHHACRRLSFPLQAFDEGAVDLVAQSPTPPPAAVGGLPDHGAGSASSSSTSSSYALSGAAPSSVGADLSSASSSVSLPLLFLSPSLCTALLSLSLTSQSRGLFPFVPDTGARSDAAAEDSKIPAADRFPGTVMQAQEQHLQRWNDYMRTRGMREALLREARRHERKRRRGIDEWSFPAACCLFFWLTNSPCCMQTWRTLCT